MSTVKAKNHQIGNDGTASNNFTIYQPSTPDGTSRWAVGVSGATTADVITVNSSGNVGIGTTSPSYKLDVGTGSGQQVIRANGGSSGSSGGGAFIASNGGTSVFSAGGYSAVFGGAYDGSAAINAATSLTFQATTGSMYWNVNGSERMRIDSSGRLLVGVTSPVGSTFSTIQYDAATYNGLGLNQSANTSGGRFMLFASQTTQCGVIDRVGTTSAVVYTTTSDRRLKENIVDAPSAIEHINAVKVRSFNWKDDGHQVKYGVIAQEFFEVEPNAVVKGDDGETIEKTWSVDSSVLVPAMIKAIQEQQTIIETLKADIAELKAKVN